MSYNIQGWLSSKSSAKSGTNLFSMNLLYYNSSRATNKYNGNIVEWQWTQGAGSQNSYALTYDKLDRLTNSNRYEGGAATNAFTEKNLTYDRNGNITQLQRYGSTGTLQDNFTYNYNGTTYNGNQLSSISGSVSATYAYDNNGNMTSDGRKNLAITYNVLNLQQTLSQSGTAVANYSWLADGTKCAVVDNFTNGFDYLGSLKYTRNGSTRTLESTDFGGGRVVYSGGVYTRYYYTTDHLGSIRVITDNSGTVQERNDYYPFGGRHANGSTVLASNIYKFNGKELQTTGFLDYGARMYDDVIGRWSVVDPMGEKYYSITPFSYCNGNPAKFIDPDGKDFLDFLRGIGKGVANSAKSTVEGIAQASQLNPAITAAISTANIIANPKGTIDNIKEGISNTVHEVINDKSGEKAGELVGNIAFTVGSSIVGTKGLDKIVKLGNAAEVASVATKGTGLGNQFKNATLNQVDDAFKSHVNSGKLELKYVNPKTGAKAYQNTKSGYSYNLDPGGVYGNKQELPHIDVNYPNPKPLNIPPKKKLPVAGGF